MKPIVCRPELEAKCRVHLILAPAVLYKQVKLLSRYSRILWKFFAHMLQWCILCFTFYFLPGDLIISSRTTCLSKYFFVWHVLCHGCQYYGTLLLTFMNTLLHLFSSYRKAEIKIHLSTLLTC